MHSGERASVTFRPAEPGAGVRFRRMDLDGTPEVPADLDHVTDTELGTTVGAGEARVLTIEHLMAALSARSGGQRPDRGDGSRDPHPGRLVSGLRGSGGGRRAGRAGGGGQGAEVPDPGHARGGRRAVLRGRPNRGLKISASIDFAHPCIGRQFGVFDAAPDAFTTDLAPARTFGFKADADALHARGLALGASLDNAVVLDEDGHHQRGAALRRRVSAAQSGRHRRAISGCSGARVHAHVVAERPSHTGNVAMAKAPSALSGAPRRAAPVADTSPDHAVPAPSLPDAAHRPHRRLRERKAHRRVSRT